MHEYLATTPFDLYSLYLFQLVVSHRSFTRAAGLAGVTQSAITRQIQSMEQSLGIDLLNRTTRSVDVTAAGTFLFEESKRLTGDVESLLQRLRENHGGVRPQIRLGVSRTIGHAYLPGFLHANLRALANVTLKLQQLDSFAILSALEANDLDVGVLSQRPRTPKTLRATYEFADAFTLVAPAQVDVSNAKLNQRGPRQAWSDRQSWILPDESSTTGRQLRRWMKVKGWLAEPAMEADNFDLIINLVSLGMGVGFVPIRALASFGRKHTLQRIAVKDRFERKLIVIIRRHREVPAHLAGFLENILF